MGFGEGTLTVVGGPNSSPNSCNVLGLKERVEGNQPSVMTGCSDSVSNVFHKGLVNIGVRVNVLF